MDTFGTYPSVLLIEGVRLIVVLKIVQCLLTINIQWLLCTVIKFHVVKEAKEAKEAVLYFLQDFVLLINFVILQHIHKSTNMYMIVHITGQN